MENTTFKYTLALEGNDMEVKAARALKKGDELVMQRVYDEYDTFEIVVSTKDGKGLDMLGYAESIGIAPFLDNGSANIVSATVTEVAVEEGESRAKDMTYVSFDAVFSYDETILAPFGGGYNETMAFMPKEDAIFSLCLYRILDYNMPIITQTHLNRYEFEVDMDDDTKVFFDIPFDDEDYFFTVEILFNETFTKCRMASRVYSETKQYLMPVDEHTADVMMTFINHVRIFNDEKTITECEIDW